MKTKTVRTDNGKNRIFRKRMLAVAVSVSLILGAGDTISSAAATPLVPKKITINVGDKKSIQVKGKFIRSKSFKSTDKKIATVNKKGVVTARGKGKCKIKVTVKYRKSKKSKKYIKKNFVTVVAVKKAKRPDTVETPAPEDDSGSELSQKELVLHKGDFGVISASEILGGADGGNLTWKSSNEAVVTVNQNGEYTAKAVGKATITVKNEKKKASCSVEVNAKELDIQDAGVDMEITAVGEYENWEGVSNAAQFTDGKGRCYFAYDTKKYVNVIKTESGQIGRDMIRLEKAHDMLGAITCDAEGNYYLVTGETNTGDDTARNTIFISKYDKEGNLIKTAGDNGSSSLAFYYDSSFCTKEPFSGGNCDVAINGNILAVHYAREMYSGHQSNSVFAVHTDSLEKVNVGDIYQSHSFAQRAIPYQNGFIFAGEGDCYNRAFTITTTDVVSSRSIEKDIFHFWVKENALDNWDMLTLNNNFAHMGGLAMADDTNAALVGSSVKALNSDAEKQTEQLFIQIFNPSKDLSSEPSYVTTGVRTGVSGPNGNEKVTDYGVKWLSDFDAETTISHPQVVSDKNGTIAILFEKYINDNYKGVFCIKLNSDGAIQKDAACLSANAHLNPCRMPVYSGGKIYWTANKNQKKDKIYIFCLDI